METLTNVIPAERSKFLKFSLCPMTMTWQTLRIIKKVSMQQYMIYDAFCKTCHCHGQEKQETVLQATTAPHLLVHGLLFSAGVSYHQHFQ